MYQVTKVLVRNLNKIIDLNWYPVEEAQKSNLRHRPMGVGVQGLADTFIKVRSSFRRFQLVLQRRTMRVLVVFFTQRCFHFRLR